MPCFPLLADPANYYPCGNADMHRDIPYRDYWFRHFREHFKLIVKLAIEQYGRPEDAHAAAADLNARLDDVLRHPERFPELHLLVLDHIREEVLDRHNIPDPFLTTKARENEAMLKFYPEVVAELDSHSSDEEELLLLVEGMFAGNIFDLGVTSTASRFSHASPDFLQVRNELGGKRPWRIDDYDAFRQRLLHGPQHRKAMFFCDNAGSDIVLGVLPFVRWLAHRGTPVVLAANDRPALNDITADELRELLPKVCALDPVMARLVESGRVRVVDSGNPTPLIDLRHVSEACNREAADVDLLFLEGMGRGLESNFAVPFRVDTVKLCMIKDPEVARRVGGVLYDVVFRYEPEGAKR